MLAQAGVTRSTMMGLPCLRIDGQFFGSFDRRTGDLLVKLPEARVDQLLDAGRAHTFAPSGRRFREWAAISPDPAAELAGAARGSPRLRRLAAARAEEAPVNEFAGFPPDPWAFLSDDTRFAAAKTPYRIHLDFLFWVGSWRRRGAQLSSGARLARSVMAAALSSR